jgi:glycosyltransferase involved in cell wall biosynthesis
MFAGMARRLKSQLSAKVLCTLSGEDIFLDRLPNPFREGAMELIRAYGQDVDGFVAVTDYFAQHATNHFGLPSDRVHVVPMGVRVDDAGEPAMLPIGSFTIGYLARVCEEKGLDRLCDALIALRRAGRDCRVRAAGYLAPADRSYLDRIRTKVELAGIGDAFEYVGEVDRPGKSAFLRSLHVLSVPTVYHEAKGLYVLEAMACGVPVVQPDHGSFPEIVRATGGGLLYDPSQPDALAEGIAQLMDDEDRRTRLARDGRVAVSASFTDSIMAEKTWELCCRVCASQ